MCLPKIYFYYFINFKAKGIIDHYLEFESRCFFHIMGQNFWKDI